MHIRAMAFAAAGLVFVSLLAARGAWAQAGKAAPAGELRRGEYLVQYGGCNDCHTPKKMGAHGPEPDPARMLSGHQADAQLPPVPAGVLGPNQWGAITNSDLTAWVGPWGTSFATNLTPDADTGMGRWTANDFIKTMRTGKHLGAGRDILPPMPWFALNALTDRDLRAVFAYLKSIKPIRNQVPEPVPPK